MLTFTEYLKSYISIWGFFAAILGCAGPFLRLFNVIEPPIQYVAQSTVLIFFVMNLIPYLFYRTFELNAFVAYRIGLTCAFLSIFSVFIYCIFVFPAYVYTDQPATGPKRQIIIAKEDDYTDGAKAFIRTNQLNVITRRQMVEYYQLPNISMVFTESGLRNATNIVGSNYVVCILCLEATFCFLVLGEGINRKSGEK
jgi:hypothetical protein